MTGNTKSNLTAREEYLDHIFRVMRENESFLFRNSQEAYGEVVELINDTIEHVGVAIEREIGVESFVKCAVFYFLNHVLVPVGGAVYVNVLTGNLPACFMELRLALESLVKCYLADLKYPDQHFFQERLHLLEEEIREEERSISSLMVELDKHLGSKKDSIALWGKLSEDWVHARGVMDGIVDHITKRSDIPPWGLVIPMNYTIDDLQILEELRKRVAHFRHLLTLVMQKHQQIADSACA